ncbi:MAG: cobalamin biosynthesis protein CbiX [Candidatus Dadabacteria bacterium]|jgi:sirohydrochlorin ferrochelatase|nr:cobalamin biosynthesis protein CbiX [Candidatus Dadabacteria bacterium]
MNNAYIITRLAGAFLFTAIFFGLSFSVLSCGNNKEEAPSNHEPAGKKIGVLLVNHGSRSETWRQTLLDLEASVREDILGDGTVEGIKTAFMEYNEPSIATRLKEYDAEGFTDIVIIPIFLTVSPHSFDDIPTIIGQKEDPASMQMLKIEKIERYTPKTRTHIAPLLDFTDILQKNVLRRVEALSRDAGNEGLVLIGYGDESYEKEWSELFDEVAEYVKREKSITEHAYGWCGHIAHYNPDETTDAVNSVLKKKQRAVVIPVLVAFDETFQVKIIGGGISNVPGWEKRVVYKPDAILPDKNIEKWVIDISREYADKIQNRTAEDI